MSPPKMGLQERFKAFMQTGPGFEDIDTSLEHAGFQGKKRADYLLWDRRLIVELKTLLVDPANEPQKFVDKLVRQRRLYIAGTISTDHVFSKLPDGQQLKRRMTLQITDSLEGTVRQANKDALERGLRSGDCPQTRSDCSAG